MPRPTDEERFLSRLPEDGSGIGNNSLREWLGWDEDKYLRVRDRLIDKGLIVRGPGQGGSVKLAPEEAEAAEVPENRRSARGRGRLSDEAKFLSLMPEDGSRVTNRNLREQLGWGEDKYSRIRDRLVASGAIARGPGPSGTIRVIEAEEEVFRGEVPADGSDEKPDAPKPDPARAERETMRRTKPRIFIGSSTEGLKFAKAIQFNLDHVADCTIWSQGAFGLSRGTLEELVRGAKNYDCAILVLTADDVTTKRGVAGNSPRDNVLFELGLFIGMLGREHTFMVYDRDTRIDLPSDLAGVTAATFSGNRPDKNWSAALGGVCTQIEMMLGL